MALTEPVLLGVLKNMVAVMRLIKGGGTYFNTIDDDAVLTEGVPLATVVKKPTVIIGHRIEAKMREVTGLTSTSVRETWGFVIEGRVDAMQADAFSRVTAFSQIVADLEVALRADVTRGGLALYTVMQQPTPYFGSANDPSVYFEQPVDVTLRRTYGVP